MRRPLPLIILRPEPGASDTAKRARSAGLDAVSVPLFAAGPIAWTPADPADFDALLLTSANAPRFAGPGLEKLAALPVWCVGAATAAAATAAGLSVQHIGQGGAQAVLQEAAAHAIAKMLWLAGEDRTPLDPPASLHLTTVTVYHARRLPVAKELLTGPAVVLVHSQRAARRLAELAPARDRLRIVAISDPVARTLGKGWASVSICGMPDDREMVAMAAKLCHEGG